MKSMDHNTDAENMLRAALLALNKIRSHIETTLYAHPLLSQDQFNIYSRIKTLRRAYDKFSRTKSQNPNASVFDIHDLLGFRVVCLFSANIVDALESLVDIIERKGPIAEISPFVQDKYSIVVYSARPDNDPLSIKHSVITWIGERGITERYEAYTPETLYSSIHIIPRVKIKIEYADRDPEDALVPIEIQVRGYLENFWGQVSHIASYSNRSANIGARNHLNALKQIVDGCTLYADLIRVDNTVAREIAKDLAENPSSVGDSFFNDRINLPGSLIDAYNAALDKRRGASQIEPQAAKTEFLDAARRLLWVETELLNEVTMNDADKKEAIYRAKMERAFCLFSADDVVANDEAHEIYRQLSLAEATDAVCRFRLAQSYRKRGEFENSRQAFLETIQILEANRDRRVDSANWIRGWVLIELGYVEFRLKEPIKTTEDKRKALQEVIAVTKKGLERLGRLKSKEADMITASNNLLYYMWEQRVTFPADAVSDRVMKTMADKMPIDRIHAVLPSAKHDSVIDTLVRVYLNIGENKKAISAAGNVVRALRDKVKRRSQIEREPEYATMRKFLTEDELDTYGFSMDVIANGVAVTN